MSRVKGHCFLAGLYSTLSKDFFSQWQSENAKFIRIRHHGPGRPNAHIMEAIGGSWEEGSVGGSLLNEGWGAEMGYPHRVDNSGNRVNGFLFRSANLVNHWPTLDAFAGEGMNG